MAIYEVTFWFRRVKGEATVSVEAPENHDSYAIGKAEEMLNNDLGPVLLHFKIAKSHPASNTR